MSNYSSAAVIAAIRNLEKAVFISTPKGLIRIPEDNQRRIDILQSLLLSIQKQSPTATLFHVTKSIVGGTSKLEFSDRILQLSSASNVINENDTSTVLNEVANNKTILGALQSLYNTIYGNNDTSIIPDAPVENYNNIINALHKLYEESKKSNFEIDKDFDIQKDMFNNF